MQVTRIYTGDDGQSHFEDLELPLEVVTGYGAMSKRIGVSYAIFRETQPSYDLDYHTAPARQFVVTLRGSVELGCGDGTTKLFGPGSIVFAEDTEGQGHTSRDIESPRESMFIQVAEGFDIGRWRR
ncbi:MAG: hypothetical protein IT303_10580 [Dehalococcoidia bacterium]|nr:hypothetical protein [Dehalococcoidia bacterium]